jgi:multidrug efflux pump subunit AcrB
MGVRPADLANVIRATYYGAEVQRLQRGRHEVKVMVTYPREDRRSLGDFNEIRVRTPNGEFPITELAEIEVVRGFTSISRRNQLRSITVSAEVEEEVANAQQIINAMQGSSSRPFFAELLNRFWREEPVDETEEGFLTELLERYPEISLSWEGRIADAEETMGSLYFLFALALAGMYILLTLQFRSYAQPFMVMAVIPFGWVGVVITHWAFGFPITLLSAFGFVALSGVVINGSILMISFINMRVRAGGELFETLVQTGQDRFRPIFLTSITTFGGLLPMVMETSLQAVIMIPMALSLAGGAVFSLFFVLLFVPVLYSYYADVLAWQGVELRASETEPQS